MQNLDWKLLSAFEAVARHGSFSRAAAELNVLQPAISRRVAQLERDVGVALIQRTRPNATLTAEGQVLFRTVASSLSQVQMALSQIRRSPDDRTLTVNTTIGFASCFLMRRLNSFREAHPEIQIELISRDLNASYRSETCDVVIVFDRPSRLPGVEHELIFEERMVAVCAPSYLSRFAIDPTALHRHSLLHLPVETHGTDWQVYLDDLGLPAPAADPAHRYNSFMVYLQATLNGDGIAIGWRYLLDDMLADGQLVKAVDHEVATNRGYFCCITERARNREDAQRFAEWCSELNN